MKYRLVSLDGHTLRPPREIWNEYKDKIMNSETKEEAQEEIIPILRQIGLFERTYPECEPPITERDEYDVIRVTETVEDIAIEEIPQLTPMDEEELREAIHEACISIAENLSNSGNIDPSKISKLNE